MRFNRKGTTKILFLPTIAAADTLIPTSAEISDGTDYTQQINAIDGWSLENQPIETPDMASTFVSKIGGDDSAADSSLTFYEDSTADDIETELAKGTSGYVVIFSKGNTAGNKGMDVFPVTVVSNSKQYSADNEPARIAVQFTITARPLFNGTVPTGP
ncbi:phage tail tube protein (plasmid) [Streptomyces sp. GDS52]|uniref:phage tail tube protein n=1 Tax=Streptomyces sp. GDS52 TaxID=3406419 RepID=UPI003FD62FD9